MAQTVKAYSPASGTVVFTAHSATGQYWNGSAFATYSAGSIASYAIAATSLGGGWYSASLDDAATSYDLRLRAGGSLATTDPVVDAYAVVPLSQGTGANQIELTTGRVKPADSSIDTSTVSSDFAPQIGGDILNLAAGDLINTNPNGVGNLIIATKTAVDALTTAVAAIPTTSGGGGTSGGNGFF